MGNAKAILTSRDAAVEVVKSPLSLLITPTSCLVAACVILLKFAMALRLGRLVANFR